MMPKTLVWTRSLDDWATDGPLLKNLIPPGTPIIHLPCLRTECTEERDFQDIDTIEAFVIASPKTVHYIADKSRVMKVLLQREVLTFGLSTQRALAKTGVKATLVPDCTSVEELGAYIVRTARKSMGLIGAAEPAFPLHAFLANRGWPVRSWAVYRTVPTPPHAEDLERNTPSVICFASPSAVKAFLKTFREPPPIWSAIALGKTTRKTIGENFSDVAVAEHSAMDQLIRTAAARL